MAFAGAFASDPLKDSFHVFPLFLVSLPLLLVLSRLSDGFSTACLETEYMSNPQLQLQNNNCFQPLDLSDSVFSILLLQRPFKTNL